MLGINPEILKWARVTANLSLEEVAKKVQRDPEVVMSWENGDSSPTYIQLETLAYKAYKRPVAIFFSNEPPQETDVKSSFRTLPNSMVDSLPARITKLIRDAKVMQLNLIELTGGRNQSSKLIWKDLKANDNNFDLLAVKVREYIGVTLQEQTSWQSTDIAMENWRNALESNGISVFKDAFREDEFSGFCLYDDEFPIVYVNNSMPKTRQIFTLFHELAHILFFTSGIDIVDDYYIEELTQANKEIEVFCNMFAASFLVPDKDFELTLNRRSFSLDLISDIADEYLVSREVVLRKLLNRQMVTPNQYQQIVNQWKRDQEKTREKSTGSGNYYNNKIQYLGFNYLGIVFQEYYSDRISYDQVADFLDVKSHAVPEIEAKYFRRVGR